MPDSCAVNEVAVTPPMLADHPDVFAPLQAQGVRVRFNAKKYPLNSADLAAFISEAQAAADDRATRRLYSSGATAWRGLCGAKHPGLHGSTATVWPD